MSTPLHPPARNHRFLTVAEAADLLGTSDVTLYRAIHNQQFPAIKIRGRYVIPSKAIDRLEDEALAAPDAAQDAALADAELRLGLRGADRGAVR